MFASRFVLYLVRHTKIDHHHAEESNTPSPVTGHVHLLPVQPRHHCVVIPWCSFSTMFSALHPLVQLHRQLRFHGGKENTGFSKHWKFCELPPHSLGQASFLVMKWPSLSPCCSLIKTSHHTKGSSPCWNAKMIIPSFVKGKIFIRSEEKLECHPQIWKCGSRASPGKPLLS